MLTTKWLPLFFVREHPGQLLKLDVGYPALFPGNFGLFGRGALSFRDEVGASRDDGYVRGALHGLRLSAAAGDPTGSLRASVLRR